MTAVPGFDPTPDDIEWAANFEALNSLFRHCGANSERAALLLSTCRNAYLTVNALFVDLQVLMGDASEPSALRAGCELMFQAADAARIKERFGRAMQTIHEFEAKQEVWQKRESIWNLIADAKKALEAVDRLAPNRIDLVLNRTRIPEQGLGDGWEHELLAIDLRSRPHLEAYFSSLNEVYSVLRDSAELGLQTAILLERIRLDRAPQAELRLEDAKDPGPEESVTRVFDLAKSLATRCRWSVVEGESATTIELGGGYDRHQGAQKIENIGLPRATTLDAINSASSSLGLLIREALYFAHFEMCKKFQSNVAKPAMPPPFVISLLPPTPSRDSGRVEELKFTRIRCSSRNDPDDEVRVAIADLAVPVKAVDWNRYQILDSAADEIKHDVRRAIEAAQKAGCRAVVFPEYSVPSSMEKELMELANRQQLVIIAGLDGQWRDNKLCDRAIVAMPGEKQAHFQCKQQPSLEEEAAAGFYRDGELRLFSNSLIGDFAVVLCSDVMELATLQVWNAEHPLPELVFIIARNKFHELYMNLAKADAIRLYAGIVIANVCDYKDVSTCEGSCVIVPRREGGQVLEARSVEVGGKFLSTIKVVDISLRAIRARSRGKPDLGYFAAPNSAKRS